MTDLFARAGAPGRHHHFSLPVEQLPTHTVRSEDQIRFQQFAYALNMYQAQGDTRDMAIGEMHSTARNLSKQRLALVMMTRVRDDITIITNAKHRLLSRIERNPGDKTSACEMLGEKKVDEGRGTVLPLNSARRSPNICAPEAAPSHRFRCGKG